MNFPPLTEEPVEPHLAAQQSLAMQGLLILQKKDLIQGKLKKNQKTGWQRWSKMWEQEPVGSRWEWISRDQTVQKIRTWPPSAPAQQQRDQAGIQTLGYQRHPIPSGGGTQAQPEWDVQFSWLGLPDFLQNITEKVQVPPDRICLPSRDCLGLSSHRGAAASLLCGAGDINGVGSKA